MLGYSWAQKQIFNVLGYRWAQKYLLFIFEDTSDFALQWFWIVVVVFVATLVVAVVIDEG